MEHTPLSMEFHEMGGYDCMSDTWDIKTGTRTLFVIDEADYPEPIEARVIASNVVKACNHHDELKAMAQDLVQLWDYWAQHSGFLQEPLRRSVEMSTEQARAILQRIEKEG